MKLESTPGSHISDACAEAAKLATVHNETVEFTFNEIEVKVQPGETAGEAEKRWERDMATAAEAWRNSPECKEREAKRAEEYRQKCAAQMVETANTEAELREAKVPRPYTIEQVTQYITSLVERNHDYGTCVYAMSMAAVAAFNYVAHKLGVTGFQASCADLDILRRTRSLDGPFILLKGEDALYPQYDLQGKLADAMNDWAPWLKEQAALKLAETGMAHPAVKEHWQRLAEQ